MTHITLMASQVGRDFFWTVAPFVLLLAFVGMTVVLIVYLASKSKKTSPSSASPVIPSTQIIPRKCPQCGAELRPDVSEGLCPACLLQRGIPTEGGAPPGTPPFTPPTIPDLAKLFPQLEILEFIGKGGMGAVYKARQPALDRFVALKILAPRSGGDLDFAERFTREARALAKLNHPNIVAVHDFGTVGQASSLSPSETKNEKSETGATPVLHYFVMEFVDGPNLRQVEQAGRLSPREALAIIPQICGALQFAHDEGIVHRDIKPENVLLDKKGRVKIADFGLAKILGSEPKDFRLTGARDVVGTPHYMAPEQVEKPQTVDHRADIYSLGVVFYEMLTGELPLGKFQPPSSCARGMQIDVRLDEVVLHALEKEPVRRYQQASQVKTAVETIASSPNQPSAREESKPDKNPMAYAALFLAGLSGVLGIVAFYLFPNPPAVLVWSIPVAALAGITLGIQTRRTRPGKLAVIGGSINTAIWLAVALTVNSATGQMHIRELTALLKGGPREVVAKTIRYKIGHDLTEAGARYDDLQVTVAVDRDSATPFKVKVSYRGLRNFKWGDGEAPAANGEFNMEYIGGGQWQGKLGGMQFTVPVAQTDNFMLPFVNDPQVIGDWETVDFVPNISDFNPDKSSLTGVQLYLKGLTFLENGKMPQGGITWTKGVVIFQADKTASHYEIREINGKSYLFFEWKSGDVTISGMKPLYYVLKKKAPASAETWSPILAPGEKPDLQKILDEAKTFMEQHKYEESLQRHLWHFNHAAEFGDPYQSVVRLTSGLSDWEELGRRYPKAKQALMEIRDSRTQQLATGQGYSEMLHEVQAINHELLDDDATVALIKTIHVKDPKLTGQNYFWMEDLLLQKGEYDLLLACMGDPQTHFESARRGFEMQIQSQQRMEEMRKQHPAPRFPGSAFTPPDMGQMATNNFVGQVCKLVEILVATGHRPDAEKIRDEAVAVLDDARLKAAVSDAEEKIQKHAAADSQPQTQDAVSAAQKWLALIDGGNYSETWKQASAIFRGAVTESGWENSMNTFRQPLGDLVSRKLKSAQRMTELPGVPDGQYVIMQFETSFANKKSTIETVTFMLEKDGQWKSAGYFIK